MALQPENRRTRGLSTPTRGPARQRLGQAIFQNAVRGLSLVSRKHPALSLHHNDIACTRDVPYKNTGHKAHTLDIYQPPGWRAGDPPCPIVFYVHGGAFQLLSKDTHWFAGSLFARQGFVVFNINYRLAPKHRYPAAIEDTCDAFLWVLENAHKYGGDVDEIVLSGESAGANLVTALTVAACYERPEPFAQRVWEAAPKLKATIPACGVLQVSDMERFSRRREIPVWLQSRLNEVYAYLPGGENAAPGEHGLADPLVLLEQSAPARPLPPVFAFVGTKDPLLDDTRRLKAALDAHYSRCDMHIYPGGIHAFHALLWRKQARACWRETFRFLKSLPWKTNRA